MKIIKILVVLLIFITFTGCPMDYSQGFRFYNNSTCAVYIDLGIISRDFGGTLYPDTAISKTKVGVLFKQGEGFFYDYSSGKECLFKKNDTLSLFIFDADTFNIYSWEEIQKGYKILQRYDISYANIKALRYNISYPPTEAMKNVKMYPPYGQ